MAEDDLIMAAAHAALAANIAVMECLLDDEEEEEIDHRTLARSTRTIYFHAQALHCIRRDYLGTGTILPIFNGRQFDMMFRVSRSRFQCMMEDIAASGNQFYLSTTDAAKKEGCSFEARLLLPLKT